MVRACHPWWQGLWFNSAVRPNSILNRNLVSVDDVVLMVRRVNERKTIVQWHNVVWRWFSNVGMYHDWVARSCPHGFPWDQINVNEEGSVVPWWVWVICNERPRVARNDILFVWHLEKKSLRKRAHVKSHVKSIDLPPWRVSVEDCTVLGEPTTTIQSKWSSDWEFESCLRGQELPALINYDKVVDEEHVKESCEVKKSLPGWKPD